MGLRMLVKLLLIFALSRVKYVCVRHTFSTRALVMGRCFVTRDRELTLLRLVCDFAKNGNNFCQLSFFSFALALNSSLTSSFFAWYVLNCSSVNSTFNSLSFASL